MESARPWATARERGPYLLPQNLGRITNAPNHTKTARIRDCRSHLRTCRNVHPCSKEKVRVASLARDARRKRYIGHTCKKDGMLNTEQLCDGSRDDGHNGCSPRQNRGMGRELTRVHVYAVIKYPPDVYPEIDPSLPDYTCLRYIGFVLCWHPRIVWSGPWPVTRVSRGRCKDD